MKVFQLFVLAKARLGIRDIVFTPVLTANILAERYLCSVAGTLLISEINETPQHCKLNGWYQRGKTFSGNSLKQ